VKLVVTRFVSLTGKPINTLSLVDDTVAPKGAGGSSILATGNGAAHEPAVAVHCTRKATATR
jgi:hypothetical protein